MARLGAECRVAGNYANKTFLGTHFAHVAETHWPLKLDKFWRENERSCDDWVSAEGAYQAAVFFADSSLFAKFVNAVLPSSSG